MSHKRQHSYKYIIVGLVSCAVSLFAPAPQASGHHAGDCSDVYTPLSSFVVNGVNRDRAAYERAMNETGVPWEMLAAIHYRETSFSHTNPGNGQGIFQFVNGEGGPYPAGPVSDEEFFRQLKFMANKLQDDYVWRGSIPRERRRLQPGEPNITLVKDTLFSYNGRAGVYAQQAAHFGFNSSLQPYEGSPYVMNRFDCSRARMGLITKDFGSMDGIDTRYGAFTVFARLRGDGYWRSISSSPFGDSFVLAKSEDPNDLRQWVLYGGLKQHVPDSQTIYAWGLQNVTLVTTTSGILDSIPTGPPLGRLFIQNGGPTIYFADAGKRYKIPWMTMFNAWNFGGQVISSVSTGLFNLPADGGNLTHAVKKADNATVYMVDGRAGNGQTVLRPYQDSTVLQAWEGSPSAYTVVSNDYFDAIDNAIGSTLTSTKMGIAGSEFEVASGMRFPLTASVASLFPGTAQAVSWETYFRLPMGSFMTHLVKSSTGPTVYLIDNGTKHQILWPDALFAWQGPNHPISIVNDAVLALIPDGASIGGYFADAGGQLYMIHRYKTSVPADLDAAYRNSGAVYAASAQLISQYVDSGGTLTGLIKPQSAPQVYLLDNSGRKRHIEWATKVDAYGGYGNVTVLPDFIVNSMPGAGSPAVFVSDGSTEYVIDGGKKWTVSANAKTNWGFGTAQTMNDGTLSRLPVGGALASEIKTPSGAFVMLRGGVGYATADPNIAAIWELTGAPTMSNALIPNTVSASMLTRFVRSNVGGDNRTFVVDNGEWFAISDAYLANLGGNGAPIMSLNPGVAPNSITDWESLVVKSSGGTHYVIDGGGKRFFPHPTIQSQWTNNGTAPVPTVSDSFLNMLPTKGHIERTIKGSGPSVYFYQNGTKRHIRFSDTYHQSYAPFVQVSDQLINAIADGPVI